jgi:malate synthase
MPTPHQIQRQRQDVNVTAADLLAVPEGEITEAGVRTNIDVGIQYLAAWLDGNGCVPIYNLMEDAATAEISRSQLWQWVNNEKAVLSDGRAITPTLIHQLLSDVLDDIKRQVGAAQYQTGKYQQASHLFTRLVTGKEFTEFLTLPAYEILD